MRAFGIKLRVPILSVVIAALTAALAMSRDVQATDLSTPSFLVATRDLQDPFFQRSVILMVPSTEPPLLAGLIINSPAKQRVRDMFPQVRELKNPQERVYLGGPVETDEVSVIFRAPSAQSSATRVFDDVYVANGRTAIAEILKDPAVTDLRVVSGKAQWLHDQLMGEVMAGAWFVIPAKPDLIFGDPKDLWSTLVKGGDLQEAQAGPVLETKLPYRLLDGTNWQRRISPN